MGGRDLCLAGVILGGRSSRQEPSVLLKALRVTEDGTQASLQLSPVQHGAPGDSVAHVVFPDAFTL